MSTQMEPERTSLEQLAPHTRRRIAAALAAHKGSTIGALEKLEGLTSKALAHLRSEDSDTVLPGPLAHDLQTMQNSLGIILSSQQQARAVVATVRTFNRTL